MEDGPADGLRKRKADTPNLEKLTRPAGRIKKLKSNALGRDKGSGVQHEDSILESIERDPESARRDNVVFGRDDDGDDERELTWSLSPERDAPAASQIDQSDTTLPSHTKRATSNFIPLPRRNPTPINTLNNYFGGLEPEPNAEQSKRTKAKGKGKKKQFGPQRTVHNYYDGSRDGVVLIADLEELRKVARLGSGAKEVTFRTKAQFERDSGKPPTKADMDETCTITSFESGIFRSKPRTWKIIEVEKQEDWRDEYQDRDRKFFSLMSKVGQSDKPFRERVTTGLLSEEIAKFQTPAGGRRRHHAYIEALKAGQYNPDALIRLEDGTYKAIYLKLYSGTRDLASFNAVTDKYGKDSVWLRSVDFDYMTHEQFDKNGTTVDAAEKMFCEYTGRTYGPNVFVRASDGKWISKNQYDEKNRNNFDEDLASIEILMLGEHNQGFVQPKTMKFQNPELYEQRMRAAHLTGYVPTSTQQSSSRGTVRMEAISDILANRNNRSSAPILVQISKDELEAVDNIPAGVKHYQIYLQNVTEKSGYTGNFTRNWRSIRRKEKFNEAAIDQNDPHFETSSASRKTKWLITDEQRRMLKTPSPSPVQSDFSDEDQLYVRQDSVSLPPDTSDDEMPSAPVLRNRRLFSLPPDSSDDEPSVFDRSRAERHSSARSDGCLPRSSGSIEHPSRPPDHSADEWRQTGGNPVVKRQLAQASEFPWPSDSSDDDSPVAGQRTILPSPDGNHVERNADRGTSSVRLTPRTSQSSSPDDLRSRTREAGRD